MADVTFKHAGRGLSCPEGTVYHEATELCWDKHEFSWNDYVEHQKTHWGMSTEDVEGLIKRTDKWLAKNSISQLMNSFNKPAVAIPHAEASKICGDKGMRLPTKAEWKAVANHYCPIGPDGKHWAYKFENGIKKDCGYVANENGTSVFFAENSTRINVKSRVKDTIEVCSTGEDPNGLCNIIGNVMEWTLDPQIVCGSSWEGHISSDCLRVSIRKGLYYDNIGFRCVAQPELVYDKTERTNAPVAFANRLIRSAFKMLGLSKYL